MIRGMIRGMIRVILDMIAQAPLGMRPAILARR